MLWEFQAISLCVFFLLVDIREIKEIRPGRNSRDFDRYQEDPCFRPEHSHCFVVLYGTEFRLKTLSLQGKALVTLGLCQAALRQSFIFRGPKQLCCLGTKITPSSWELTEEGVGCAGARG